METTQQPKEIEVGQIFYASWGYEQTNIDFCKVVGFTKTKKTAICRMMSQRVHDTEGCAPMSEHVVPHEELGETFRLKVKRIMSTQEPMLVGSYPFCERDKRFDHFWPWDGKPTYQSHYH